MSLTVNRTIYLYAQRLISDQAECDFVRLRYLLGGDRPSQTTRHGVSPTRITGQVSRPDAEGWCSIDAEAPTYALHPHPNDNPKV